MDGPFVSMLLLAAGRGARFGGGVPKAWLPLRGRTLVERSLTRLARLLPSARAEIVLAVHDDDRARLLEPLLPRLQQLGLTKVVSGGATRQDSMRHALAAGDPHAQLVLVHDAARPFFPLAAAAAAVAKAAATGAALLAMPAPDTLKEVDGTRVRSTRPRDGVWSAQTPQVMRRDLLQAALAQAA